MTMITKIGGNIKRKNKNKILYNKLIEEIPKDYILSKDSSSKTINIWIQGQNVCKFKNCVI